jgi:hypothetical protein
MGGQIGKIARLPELAHVNVKGQIDTGQIQQLEWTHRVAGAKNTSFIDIFEGRNTHFQHPFGFSEDRRNDTVENKSVDFLFLL